MGDDAGWNAHGDRPNAVQRGFRHLGGTGPMAWVSARVQHQLDAPALRLSSGRRCVTSVLTGLPVFELTAVGARSGERRTLPLIGVPDGDIPVIVLRPAPAATA